MKKLLSCIGALAVFTSAGASVVSCDVLNSNGGGGDSASAVDLATVTLNYDYKLSRINFFTNDQQNKITNWAALMTSLKNNLFQETRSKINWKQVQPNQVGVMLFNSQDHRITENDFGILSKMHEVKVAYYAIGNNDFIKGQTTKLTVELQNDAEIQAMDEIMYLTNPMHFLKYEGDDASLAHEITYTQDNIIRRLTSELQAKNGWLDKFKLTATDAAAKFDGTTGVNFPETDITLADGDYQLPNIESATPNDHTFKIHVASSLVAGLNNFQNENAKGVTMADLPMAELLPTIAKDLLPEKIKNYLENVTFKKLYTDIFDPHSKLASLIPNQLPLRDDTGKITTPEWITFHNALRDYFSGTGIDFDSEMLTVDLSKTIAGLDKLTFTVGKVIDGLAPDIVHFHNFLVNKGSELSQSSFIANLLDFMFDPIQDYNAANGQPDGFSLIDWQIIKQSNQLSVGSDKRHNYDIRDNFDVFIYDVFDNWFVSPDGKSTDNFPNYAIHETTFTKKGDMSLIPLSIYTTTGSLLLYGYYWFTAFPNPSDNFLQPIIESLLKPTRSVNDPVSFKIGIDGYFDTTINLPFGPVHEGTMNRYLATNGFFADDVDAAKQLSVKINSGDFRFMVQLTNNQSADWIQLTSFDDFKKDLPFIDKINFELSNMDLQIIDAKNPNVNYENTTNMNLNMYL